MDIRKRTTKAGLASVAVLALLGACVAPMTQVGPVSAIDVAGEVLKQQQLFIQSSFEQQERVSSVAGPLLRAAVPLCGNSVTTRMGVSTMNRSSFTPEYRDAARALGFSDTLEVVAVQSGSPAEKAGLAPHDRLLALSGVALPTGEEAPQVFRDRLDRLGPRVSLTVSRDSHAETISIARDTVCDYDVIVARVDAVNASADGKHVYVNSGLLRLVSDDDELAAILGHEIAHNAMHHLDAKKSNAFLGGLVGLIFDVAAAKQGVNTNGSFTNQMASAGAMVYSADFEREADYVGIYIMAAAGRNTASAANVWRRMAQFDPRSITLAVSHPTSAERFVRLDQWQKEIDQRLAAGLPLRLAMKNGTTSAPLSVASQSTATTGTARALASKSGRSAQTAESRGRPAADRNTANLVSGAADAKPAVTEPVTKVVGHPASAAMPKSDDRMAVAIIGAPSSDSARIAAIGAFDVGKVYIGRHEWSKAEEWFKRTLLLDGSMAEYHAALGSVEMVLGKWEEAEAEYTAASLIDVVNADYRTRILEARRRKQLGNE